MADSTTESTKESDFGLGWELDLGCDSGGAAAAPPAGSVAGPRDYALDEGCLSGAALDAHVAESHAWYASVGSPRLWVAPLVAYSDASFRQLARECGAHIAHTQMLDAGGWSRSVSYRRLHEIATDGGPLVVQLGGSRAEQLGAAAEMLAALPTVAGIELNLGCPQRCARKLRYGSFLAEDVANLRRCVAAMRAGVDAGSARRPPPPPGGGAMRCALLCKIRCFGRVEDTVAYARLLEALGAHLVTVHGRTRHQGGGRHTGSNLANWGWIRAVKAALRVPVVANGNVRDWRDVEALLAATACEGAMSGVGALRRPHKTFCPVERLPAARAAEGGCGRTAPPEAAVRLRARPRFASRAHAAARYLEIALERNESPYHVHTHLTGKLALVSYSAAGRAAYLRFDGAGRLAAPRDGGGGGEGGAEAEGAPAGSREGSRAAPEASGALELIDAVSGAASAGGMERAAEGAQPPAARPNHLGSVAWAFRKLCTFRNWESEAAQRAVQAMRAALAAQCEAEEAVRAARTAELGSDAESGYDYDKDSDDEGSTTAGG